MTRKIIKTEGGQGGKLGHGQMSHWEYTEILKKELKKKRRKQSKVVIQEQGE
jgi:hypothetical protein